MEAIQTSEETRAKDHSGARWWSLDIHAHSPASFDYGGLDGVANDGPKPSFKEWIQAYIAAGVDGIVITDHNSHQGIAPARAALEQLRQENPELAPFVIFPGVEITATGGIHILGVFDPSNEAEIVNKALTLCQYDGTRGESDKTANKTVADVADVIVKLGGICIPAHADRARGVFGMDDREVLDLAKSRNILAVEVADDKEVTKARSLNWVPLLGSDAHHLTTESCPPEYEAKAPGTHVTLIKAETLNLDGLRLALTDPDESVRRCRQGYADPNETGHGHINRIQVVQGETAQEYTFSPWMNCLIGGRGVGKSTLIELLRLALGRSPELDGSVAKDLHRFSPRSDPDQRWWNDETRIIVDYTKDQRLLRITWSGSSPETSELHLWTGTTWEAQSGRAVDRAPIRVFSQKQIYELATSPQSFLKILDDMPEIRRNEWNEEYDELQHRFRAERNKLRQLRAEAEKADRIRGHLQEVQGRLQHLDQLRASSEYRELEATEARIRDASTAEQQSQSIAQRLTADADALRDLAKTESLMVDEFSAMSDAFETAAALLDRAASTLSSARNSWVGQFTASLWQQRVAELTNWLSTQGESEKISPEQTQTDRQREAELEAELAKVEASDARVQSQQSVIDDLLKQISAKRRELFTRRSQYTDKLSVAAKSPTKVEVRHQGDVEHLGDNLRDLLNFPESFESAFSKEGIGAGLLKHHPMNPQFPSKVEDFKKALIEFAQLGPISEIGKTFKVDARFYNRLVNADEFDLETNILLWFPEDLVAVQYRPGDGRALIPVDRGSPGQKTAALLAVILQMGKDPLVLDQPEDDLENKLIRSLAVETLRTIKSSRQLIVSTHNANVVVTSAAENILVLQHGEKFPGIEAQGALQVLEVKNNVCEILEGGEEAIRTRYRRLIGSHPNDT